MSAAARSTLVTHLSGSTDIDVAQTQLGQRELKVLLGCGVVQRAASRHTGGVLRVGGGATGAYNAALRAEHKNRRRST